MYDPQDSPSKLFCLGVAGWIGMNAFGLVGLVFDGHGIRRGHEAFVLMYFVQMAWTIFIVVGCWHLWAKRRRSQ